MIEGVVIKKLVVHEDVPDTKDHGQLGILMEILRSDEDLMKKFGQSTYTVSHPGTIKAFHWHEKQDDLWFIPTGRARVVLYDLRKDSKTYKETQVIFAGVDDYKLILIPIGVAHGYQVVSKEPVSVFYHTTEVYDPDNLDEKRIPYDDPDINFDWSKD